MKVGDLVRVKLPTVIPYIGIVVAINAMGGALVRSMDAAREYWIYDWSAEVLNESR
jgi:hypothetical protein